MLDQYINLRCYNIGDQGMSFLSEALKVNNTIEKIALNNGNIGSYGLKSLVEALKINKSNALAHYII